MLANDVAVWTQNTMQEHVHAHVHVHVHTEDPRHVRTPCRSGHHAWRARSTNPK